MVRHVEELRSGRQETCLTALLYYFWGRVYHSILGIITENRAPESRTAPNANSIEFCKGDVYHRIKSGENLKD
jgi:hypothetical protein